MNNSCIFMPVSTRCECVGGVLQCLICLILNFCIFLLILWGGVYSSEVSSILVVGTLHNFILGPRTYLEVGLGG